MPYQSSAVAVAQKIFGLRDLGLSRRSFLLATSSSALALLTPLPSAAAYGPIIPAEEFLRDLKAHLDQLAAEDAFSGAVLIAKDGKVLFQQAYGYAERAFNIPNKIDTKFNLASMGKMFTAVAILQLVQAGKMSLDDKLIKLVPDYPDKGIAEQITVYELLTHTSGLGDMFTEKFGNTAKDKLDTIQAHLPLFAGKPLLFKPGTSWSYSNAGFIVLGLVIERVSGNDYYTYIREHVFEPAGMLNTEDYRLHDDVPNMAVGYTMVDFDQDAAFLLPGVMISPPFIKNSDFLQRGASAGGGYSTVDDLLRFSEALQGHKLLDPHFTVAEMTGKIALPHGASAKYGFGMEERFVNGVRIVGHSGGAPGINSNLDMYPELGYTVIIMTNFDNAAALANGRIRMWLTGESIPQAVVLSRGGLRSCAGTYTASVPGEPHDAARPEKPNHMPPMEIRADATGLWLDFSNFRHRLMPLSDTDFFDDNVPSSRFSFARDNKGAVTGFSASNNRTGKIALNAIRVGR